jgi:SAM-dependent methyltransferase
MESAPTEVFEALSTIEQWNSNYYHPIAQRLYDQAIADMLRIMDAEPGATIMDAGCGPGAHAVRVANAGYRVCAVDISAAMLDHARRVVEDANLQSQVDFCQQDLAHLDFADASFRYVFSWGVIIHIPDATRALDELMRIIEPGGKLALYLTNKTAVDHKIESWTRRVLRKPLIGVQHLAFGDGIWYEMNGERLWLWRIDSNAITNYVSENGFRLINRRTGELSEIQVRLNGLPRRILLHLNNLAYRVHFPPYFACSSLYIFEKVR